MKLKLKCTWRKVYVTTYRCYVNDNRKRRFNLVLDQVKVYYNELMNLYLNLLFFSGRRKYFDND